MPAYVTTTHNSVTFGVSSEPMPSREVTNRGTMVGARLLYKAASPYETGLQDFEKAILGWTRIDPINTDRLNRFFPLTVPLHQQGSCDAIRLRLASISRTADPDNATAVGGINPSTVNNPSPNAWWPTAPFNMYDCEFGQLPYSRFKTDAEAYATPSSGKELSRYIRCEEIPTPREFRRTDHGAVIDNPEKTEILQIGFVPFIQAEVFYTWFAVPYPDGVPWNAIITSYLKVNNADFDGANLFDAWPAGELLFTRVLAPDDFYFLPGGEKVVDLKYCFTWNIMGWNRVLRANGTYANLIRKNVTPPTPVYLGVNFDNLFVPGA